jgi:hypothetical protein
MLSLFTVANCPLTTLPVGMVKVSPLTGTKNWLEVKAKSFAFKCLQSAGIGAGLATARRVLAGTAVF